MTTILGINAFHADAAACVVRDGRIVAAAEEERFRRVKHWSGFPVRAIGYCLDEAGIALSGVDHVAVNQDSTASLARRAAYLLGGRPDLRLVLDRVRRRRSRAGIDVLLARAFPGTALRGEVHAVEHHVAHLASAFFASPFAEAAVVSVDGFGDFASAAWGTGRGTRIDVDGRIHFPHSLGIFYEALTQFLGFPAYGDEYKVMGMAPYGRPAFVDAMRRIVRLDEGGGVRLDLDCFRHHRERIECPRDDGAPTVGPLWAAPLAAMLGPARAPDEPLAQRHLDIACSVQAMYEEAFVHLLAALHRRCGQDALAIAGGCGNNSVANGKVTQATPFRHVYVHAAPGDAGGALGAAWSVWHALGGARCPPMDHAYWGPGFDDDAIAAALDARRTDIAAAGCTVERVADAAELCRRTAAAIADGRVAGWFQGRMEWGPRALGNRSILADPRRADMKDVLNARIKRREAFRPFAPSVLSEAAHEWFEGRGDAPFMTEVRAVRAERRARIPAVTHVDGSARLQTVRRETNPLFHRLLEAFRDLTGVPLLLNTSFNENEPVVCRPDEAIDCFLRTRMDVLAIGHRLLARGGA